MPLDHGPRTGTRVEFWLVLIAVWVWAAAKAVIETRGSGEGRMPSTSPGDQDYLALEEGRSNATSDWQQS